MTCSRVHRRQFRRSGKARLGKAAELPAKAEPFSNPVCPVSSDIGCLGTYHKFDKLDEDTIHRGSPVVG